jgi:hypothetical protein
MVLSPSAITTLSRISQALSKSTICMKFPFLSITSEHSIPLTVYTTRADLAAIHHGIGTYYFQGGAVGSCGISHTDSDRVVALSENLRQGSSNCGKKIWAKALNGPGAGQETFAFVADTCPGCVDTHIGKRNVLVLYPF